MNFVGLVWPESTLLTWQSFTVVDKSTSTLFKMFGTFTSTLTTRSLVQEHYKCV